MSPQPIRRGSTMILVVSMLVLLVLIAAAFVSRAQSGRVLASAQQGVAAQSDRVGPIANAVTDEIAGSLFPRAVDGRDAALASTAAGVLPTASAAVPRLAADDNAIRYGVDVLDRLNNSTLAGGSDGIIDGYNFAPYEVRPWTNWPDSYNQSPAGDIRSVEANPVGNPSFGDCRWLRSTEPVRVIYQGQFTFSHWAHLSWIPTANNGWRLVTDIADVAANTAADVAPSATAASFFPNPPRRWGLEIPYEQWLPSVPPDPVLWIPTTIGAVPAAPSPPYPNVSTPQGEAALLFRQLALGATPNPNPVGGWFSSQHPLALGDSEICLPNFLRLKWFGPRSDEFVLDSPRNIITRTLCDTDGDGFTDSFWFLAPTSIDRSVRHVVGVSIVDNSALLNVNVATQFNPANTGGKTPSDVALVGNAVRPDSDTFSSGPTNPANSRVGYLDSDYNCAGPNTYENGSPQFLVKFDRARFGGILGGQTALADFRTNPTLLSELGVVAWRSSGTQAAEAIGPFRNLLQSDLERTTYFKAMSRDGDVDNYFSLNPSSTNFAFEQAAGQGDLLRFLASGGATATLRSAASPITPAQLDPFTMADEYELRAFHGNNSPALRSRLERAVDSEFNTVASESQPMVLGTQFLRSAVIREETSEFNDQLDGRQLLFDNRRKLTTISGARNEMMPPWLWTMPPASRLGQQPGQPSTWPAGTERGWKDLHETNYGWGDYSAFQSVPVRGGFDPTAQFPDEPGASMGDGNCDGVLDEADVQLARAQFNMWNTKTDLNREVTDDNAGPALYLAHQHNLARDIVRVLQRSLLDVDSRISIFGQEFSQAQPNFNRNALREARRAVLSWTANIIAALDGPRQWPGMILPTDAPLHPERGLITEEGGERLSFIGQEKHPFITQVFFGVVYPKTGVVPQGVTGAGNSYVCYDPAQAANATDGSGARVVLAVQIANPYNTPIDLWSYRLRVFGQEFQFLQPPAGASNGNWGYGVTPVLGPTTESGPRTATVFAIPKTMGVGAGRDLNFRAHMMNFLDLTHPWLRPGVATGTFPNLLQAELAAVPSAEVFPVGGGNVADLFEDPSTPYADCLVFNASQPTEAEPALEAGSNKWSVKPNYYANRISGAQEGRDISLIRLVADPLAAGNSYPLVVDRLENQLNPQQTNAWLDQLRRMLEPPAAGQEDNQFVPPPYLAPDPGSATQQFPHVDIGLNDFLMSWTRISRPWVLDIDGNSEITENERSPRYVFAHDLGPRSVALSSGQQNTARLFARVGPPEPFAGEVFQLNDLQTKPDSLVVSSARSPFNRPLMGKPTNFSLCTFVDNDGRTRLYLPFGSATGAAETIYGDTGAGVPNRNLDFYRHPIRLAQRDGPFEQVAEIYDVPVWGPVLQQQGSNWTVRGTMGEMLVGDAVANAGQSGGGTDTSTSSTRSGGQSADAGFPTFGANPQDQRDTARFQFQRSRTAIRSVVGFVPAMPAGASILDGFTLDRAGFARKDLDNDGALGENGEMMAFEQRRLRLARGFTGALTPGLVNLNTAPLEVLRALPNMQYLSYNRDAVGGAPQPPFPPTLVKVNFPETIINYRDRYRAAPGFLDGPKYDDRGFVPVPPATDPFPFHPGMRGERGFVSVGELAVLDREFRPSQLQDDPEAVAANTTWQANKSWSVNFAGRDPYRTSEDPPVVQPPTGGHTPAPVNPPPTDAGSGWRAPTSTGAAMVHPPLSPVGGRFSAQLATERLATSVIATDNLTTTNAFDPVFALGQVAGDQVERNALLKGIANIATTRSDVFTVYLRVRSVAQNQQTGKWDATDPNTLIDESRYLMVVDRSNVNRPSDEPRILMFERITE